jgi:DNA-binding MarR family transcriptional regulator
MTKRNQNGGASATKPESRASSGVSTSAAKQFARPLTTSLKAFVKNGSDREFRELVFELNSLFNQMKRHQEHFARYIGVNPAQFTFILVIAEMPNITVKQIADRMNVSSPFVTAEIGKLVEMGIVRKMQNDSDRRSSLLALTPKGENLTRELAPILCRANDLHFRSLTGQTGKAFKETIHTIVMDGKRVLHELESPDMRSAVAPSTKLGLAAGRKSLAGKREP